MTCKNRFAIAIVEKGVKLRSLLVLLVCFVNAGLGVSAWAQSVNEYVSLGAPDPWVEIRELQDVTKGDYPDRDSYYLLVDWQDRLDVNEEVDFVRYAEVLTTSNAVENSATLQIQLDPDYHKIKIHHVRVIRDGQIIDKTNLENFEIFRAETERDKLIYNGRLELSYLVPDVRAGDVLDYAYSRYGKNPALKGHFSIRLQQSFDDVVLDLHHRLLISNTFPVNELSLNGGVEPEITKGVQYDEYQWELSLLEPEIVDADQPSWAISYPQYHLSSFKDWSEVGQYFAPHYEIDDTDRKAIQDVVGQIQAEHSNPSDQLRAALDFVQSNIRYVGVEIGSGGYIPRSPQTTMEKRYGDCKDMTLLLKTFLSELDIEAKPVLVDFDRLGGLSQFQPSYTVFDHVLIRAEVGGKAYILDPTRGQQLGDLSSLQQGVFYKGVEISAESRGMLSLDVPTPEFHEDFLEVYDMVDMNAPIKMRSVSTYHAYRADSMYNWYKREGTKGVADSFLKFYQDKYPTIEQVGDVRFETDASAGWFKIEVNYEIPDAWDPNEDDGMKYLDIYASETDSNIPDFKGSARSTPFGISHPIHGRQVIRLQVNDNWSFEDEEVHHSFDAFDYSKVTTFEDDLYEETYIYKTKQDHIDPEKFPEVMAVLSEIDDELGVALRYPIEEVDDPSEDWVLILLGLLWVAGLLGSSIYVLMTIKHHDPSAAEQVFYPVRLSKFIPMTILTFGMYELYWAFRQWRWVRVHKGEKIWPTWRAIFGVITNFSLFPRMARESEQGFKWFKNWAIPLATIILLLNICSAMIDEFDVPLWTSIAVYWIALLAFVPVVMQVEKLNEERPNILDENSKYGWQAILGIIVSAPLYYFIFLT